MEISVVNTDALGRRMTVALTAEVVDSKVNERLKSLAAKVRVDGFRPGKVPFRVVESRYGAQVREEVREDVLQQSFREAIVKERLRPVGSPRVESTKLEPGKGFEFVVTFEVYPEVRVNVPANLKIEKPVVVVSDADIDHVIERMRKQQVSWVEVDRPAREGDQVNVDFVGSHEGVPFDGGTAKSFDIVIGAKSLVAGFEEGLIGKPAGEQRVIEVTFPENYGVARLAGKQVKFDVTVNRVSEAVLPDVDMAFAQKFGINSVEELRAQVKENITRETSSNAQTKVKTQVIEALLGASELETPRTLLESEIDARMEKVRTQLRQGGVGEEHINLERQVFVEPAQKSVKVGLIVAEIIKQNQLKASPESIRNAVEEIAATYEHPEEVVRWYYASRERLADIEALILEDLSVEWALGKAEVAEVVTTVAELLYDEKR